MKITEKQYKEARAAFDANIHHTGYNPAIKAAIESISTPLPTLRPIAEMSEMVPEGCERITGYFKPEGKWTIGNSAHPSDTFGIDILLPVESPEDKMRAEFEAWATQTSPQRHLWETFTEDERGWIFNAWKAAKSTPETK